MQHRWIFFVTFCCAVMWGGVGWCGMVWDGECMLWTCKLYDVHKERLYHSRLILNLSTERR